jgi:4-hydroxybenzoate polyprenyltransferase/phosphoglycolate phosphatase-like HAD superfamily hydrolase
MNKPIDYHSALGAFPLVVDLDGTLVRTDLLYESFFATAAKGPWHYLTAIATLLHGKVQLKAYLADSALIDYRLLPFDEAVLSLIRDMRAESVPVYLATANDRRHAEGIAAHLGLFDGVFSSDRTTDLSGETKARKLMDTFGAGRFDYVGNSPVDMPVWSQAHKAYTIGVGPRLARKVDTLGVPVEHLERKEPSFHVWSKALRVHQYAKNVLIFVPLLTAHAYTLPFFLKALLAFVAFSLCASSVYILNDLVDLDADRRHPTKRKRPFASGEIPIVRGMVAIGVLLVLALSCALVVSLRLFGVLVGYFALTLAYSLSLKRKLLVDVVVLAMLYTARVITGSVALPVIPSEWLLAFSMFAFTSLALVKRYAELTLRIEKELPDSSNRDYRLADLPIIGALAAASGFNAVTIFSLYISSPAVRELYRRPELLWLICPILLYWLGRVVLLVHRRVIDEDPMLFAVRDRISYLAGGLMIAIIVLAT